MYPKNILERFYVIQQNNFAATAVTRSSVRCVCCSKFLIHGALLSNYASAEQCSSDRSRGTKTISRQPVAHDVTLAARSAEDRVQSGSADVQSPQHIDAIVPPSPNPGPTTHTATTCDRPLRRCVNLPRRRLLRSALIDALHRLFGTHYRKLSSITDSVTVFKTFLFSRAFPLPSS